MENAPDSGSPASQSDPYRTLARRAGKFSFATLISRILGYARDASVAYLFGGETATDTFYTAFRTSNLLRRLLGEGALASSFVPVFSHALKNESKEEVQKFLNSIFSALLALLTAATLAGIYFTPHLMSLIAPGFKQHPEKFALTVQLTRWMFPFFLFISLAALVTGVLNSLKHFFLPAVAPAMLSVCEIGYLFLFMRHLSPDAQLVGLAVSVVAGGATHFAFLLPRLFSTGFRLRWTWRWNHPYSVRVVKLMIPAMIGLSVDQINAFVDTICATFLVQGSVSALYNSNRLMQLPLALFGISVASVSLPAMSDHTADKDYLRLNETVHASLGMIIFMVLPASVGLIALARPIVALLFEHGEFTAFAAQLTTRALQGYCLGLIVYSGVKVLSNAFYSLRSPQTPVKVAVACVALNIVLNILLMGPLGVSGLALATSISSAVNAALLFHFLRRQLKGRVDGLKLAAADKKLAATLGKTALACAAMLIYLLGLMKTAGGWPKAVQVLAGISGGALVFFAVATLLRMKERRLILHMAGWKGNLED